MKKKITFILAIILCLCLLFGCVSEPTPGIKEDIDEGITVFNNVTDFSNKQGYHNWYYCYGEVDDVQLMTFNMEGGRWNGRDWYSFIEVKQSHPGNNSETFMMWKAPRDGKVVMDIKITRCPTDFNALNADGVFVYVSTSLEKDYLFSKLMAKDEKLSYVEKVTRTVTKGEKICFVTNASGNNSFDNTRWEIDIKY